MIDTLLSLAFSLQSQKGVYALLLGSGVSRSAGIPTGWEVVLDLIRKLAKLQGENCDPDPEVWFRQKHGEEPNYSKLLDALAPAPAGRQQLLRSYFEPTDDERSQGLKIPTGAHKAISKLVAGGYVRVIVTTNFDRLIEKALEEGGVHPTVISTPDAILGALPLAHAGCTVIKLHGDYLDTRIRNTPTELEMYDDATNQLLDRVLDEYGLIVCGWSGEWDSALRAAILRARSRRFTTYWADRGNRGERANQLIRHRNAQVIAIRSADHLFVELAEKVTALEESQAPHPMSVQALVATAKRYLPEDHHRIRLFDLVHGETEKLKSAIEAAELAVSGGAEPTKEVPRRVAQYDSLSGPLAGLFSVGCYWGQPLHRTIWIRTLERLAAQPRRGGYESLEALRKYPALLLLYAGGLAATIAEQFETLRELFVVAKVRCEHRNLEEPFVVAVNQETVMNQEVGWLLPGMTKQYTPLSDHLVNVLRAPLQQFLPDDSKYQDAFDRFEYFLALAYASVSDQIGLPLGRFGWRNRRFNNDLHVSKIVGAEVEEFGIDWPPLRAGLFGGTVEGFKAAEAKVLRRMSEVQWH
jgi:hypothetical protein